jgi:hypothetical protein
MFTIPSHGWFIFHCFKHISWFSHQDLHIFGWS